MTVPVNYLAVFVAAIVSMVVGFIWYSPILFAAPWMKLMGYTPESMKKDQQRLGKIYTISFVLSLITAYILSHVMTFSMNYFQGSYSFVSTGVITAFWMWLGFVFPVQMTDALFGGRPGKLIAINTGYQLASLLGMGITLGLFH